MPAAGTWRQNTLPPTPPFFGLDWPAGARAQYSPRSVESSRNQKYEKLSESELSNSLLCRLLYKTGKNNGR